MGAVKGVGQGAVDTIVAQRKEGKYRSIFDLAKRIDLRAANKKAFENLALAGGFDCFETTHRAQYFHHDGDSITFLEKAIRYGSKFQENENSAQVSLFGETSEVQIAEPQIPPCEEWTTMVKLAREREVVGIYISGHPLDDYRFEMSYFCNVKLENFKNQEALVNKTVAFGGIVTNVQYKTGKSGKDWAQFTIEGYDESFEFRIFDEEYLKYRHFLVNNQFLFFKVLVREGWVNRETGKRADPRISFQEVKLLADVLPTFAKKLVIQFNIKDLHQALIQQLAALFQANSGDQPVTFEVMELERIKKKVELEVKPLDLVLETTEDGDNSFTADDFESELPIETDEIRVLTHLAMPSRKTKIKITSDLLSALEQLQVKFKLN
jgi:DNA polymerase-3 subunit alpha